VCHNIAGTPATGRTGPDLSHVASRRMLASGTLPNTRGNLAGWILDPQGIKPGTKMPSNQLQPSELQALLAYLESLR
jgi:cytochrome c oxidase subunit 2